MTAVASGALLVALVGACSSPAPTAAPVERQPAWQVRAAGGARPIDPGPAAATLLDAAGCATCHATIAAEWRTSRHALAWTNGLFQREYRQHPEPWCVNCHAPLTTQQAELRAMPAAHPHADQGVDCATCHVRGGALISTRRRPGSPHATVVDPTFGSPAFCADCHQFTFPVLDDAGQVTAMTAHPMQTTVASFAAGPYAAKGDCMQCHGSKTNHGWAGGHDPGMVGAALEVAWCRAPAGTARLTITNAAAGHSVPTGDVGRHMVLRAWRSSTPGAMFDVFLGRRFEAAPDGGEITTGGSSTSSRATRSLRTCATTRPPRRWFAGAPCSRRCPPAARPSRTSQPRRDRRAGHRLLSERRYFVAATGASTATSTASPSSSDGTETLMICSSPVSPVATCSVAPVSRSMPILT